MISVDLFCCYLVVPHETRRKTSGTAVRMQETQRTSNATDCEYLNINSLLHINHNCLANEIVRNTVVLKCNRLFHDLITSDVDHNVATAVRLAVCITFLF